MTPWCFNREIGFGSVAVRCVAMRSCVCEERFPWLVFPVSLASGSMGSMGPRGNVAQDLDVAIVMALRN